MTGKFFSKKVLLAKLETTYGVAASGIGASNAMLVSNFSMKPMALTVEKRQRAYPNFGADPDMMAQKHVTMQFEVEAAGSGAAGTAPFYDALLQACGLSSTVSASVSVAYAPISTGQKSVTLSFFWDGLNRVVTGAMGSLKLTLQGGKLPMFQFSFTGLWADATDTAAPSVTSDLAGLSDYGVEVSFANTSIAFGNASVTYGASSGGQINVTADKFEMDLGNSVIFRDRPNAAYVALTGRTAKGSITFEQTTVATEDWQAMVAASTTLPFGFQHGITAGNKIFLSAARVQLGEPSDVDLQGILGVTFPLGFIRTDGDDEVSITFE